MQNTPKEWSMIEKIRFRVQRQNKHNIVPLGDDAFVFKNYPGYSVICQDMMVEGVHFDLKHTSAFDLGFKALAVNLSDIAAMGAQPHYAQVSLALPQNLNDSWLDDFYQGMTQLADDWKTEIVGGDLAATSDKLVVDVSAHGSCENPITRKGAQPGDLLMSSGPLGLSFTGLTALQKNLPGYETAKEKHLRPRPRLDLVKGLQTHHARVHALMDCSDGLINDAMQLTPAGGGFHIFAESLPVHTESQQLALQLGMPVSDFALWGGEDYELLMAVSPNDYDRFSGWHMVGQFTDKPGVFLTFAKGQEEITDFKGWRHFK